MPLPYSLEKFAHGFAKSVALIVLPGMIRAVVGLPSLDSLGASSGGSITASEQLYVGILNFILDVTPMLGQCLMVVTILTLVFNLVRYGLSSGPVVSKVVTIAEAGGSMVMRREVSPALCEWKPDTPLLEHELANPRDLR